MTSNRLVMFASYWTNLASTCCEPTANLSRISCEHILKNVRAPVKNSYITDRRTVCFANLLVWFKVTCIPTTNICCESHECTLFAGRSSFVEKRYIWRLRDKSHCTGDWQRIWSCWTRRHSQLPAEQKRHCCSRLQQLATHRRTVAKRELRR